MQKETENGAGARHAGPLYRQNHQVKKSSNQGRIVVRQMMTTGRRPLAIWQIAARTTIRRIMASPPFGLTGTDGIRLLLREPGSALSPAPLVF